MCVLGACAKVAAERIVEQQLEEAVEAEMTKLHTTLAQQLDDSAQYVCSRLVEWVGLL